MAARNILCMFGIIVYIIGNADAACTYTFSGSGTQIYTCHEYYSLSAGAIAGAVIGSLTCLALIIYCIAFCCWRIRKSSEGSKTPGTIQNPSNVSVVSGGTGEFSNQVMQNPNQQNYQMASHGGSHTLRMHTGYDQ
ncbi:uncharacterized protein LOC134231445 [Saccostrea cucullata]|uniref:uncharacterized protein LOC134231445 n=1 Tax=Saccostrea cuccullata TaxID=36930 RepID=UPI002ED02F72